MIEGVPLWRDAMFTCWVHSTYAVSHSQLVWLSKANVILRIRIGGGRPKSADLGALHCCVLSATCTSSPATAPTDFNLKHPRQTRECLSTVNKVFEKKDEPSQIELYHHHSKFIMSYPHNSYMPGEWVSSLQWLCKKNVKRHNGICASCLFQSAVLHITNKSKCSLLLWWQFQ